MHRYRYAVPASDEVHDQLGLAASLIPLQDEKLLAFAKQKLLLEQSQEEEGEEDGIDKRKSDKHKTGVDLDILDHQFIARVDKDLQQQYEQLSEEIVDHLLARCLIETTIEVDELFLLDPELLQKLLESS